MLDVLTDFWKPVKKQAGEVKVKPDEMDVGSVIGFGFVPQAVLNGRRLEVSAINTYQFGEETLTSFVLSQPSEPPVLLIVAESEGEQYLAISRRISFSERIRLFDSKELDEIIEKADEAALKCHDTGGELKGWLASFYRRDIRAMKGRVYKGDYRTRPLPSAAESQEFDYYLLVSESNEQAIEIERYPDGRMELYTTIYRRISDIGQITHPARVRPPVLESSDALPVAAIMPLTDAKAPEAKASASEKIAPSASAAPVVKAVPAIDPVRREPAVTSPPPAAARQESKAPQAAGAAETVNASPTENKTMLKSFAESRQSAKAEKVEASVQPVAGPGKEWQAQKEAEIITVQEKGEKMTEEKIECDLRVALKIIDEAMRNEIKISDLVRRIVDLPLAEKQMVQIPLQLSDSDYSVLGRRYGLDPNDQEAIRRRVVQDLADFSGNGNSHKGSKAA